MSYCYPTTDTSTTPGGGSFQGHVDRDSVNPGCDYDIAKGTIVRATEDGKVTAMLSSLSGTGAAGRYIHIDHPDGNATEYLHLSRVDVGLGPVSKGQQIGLSGGSGYGKENYYGYHLHITIRTAHGYVLQNHGNFDFDSMMKAGFAGGDGTLIDENEDTMIQPIPTRIIRSCPTATPKGSGDIVMLHPTGISKLGDPLTPDFGTMSGQGWLAGQPVGGGMGDPDSAGRYWIDLPGDRFSSEVNRHRDLIAAADAHYKSLGGASGASADAVVDEFAERLKD